TIRGKIALPFTRSGAELSTVGVPAGRPPPVLAGAVGVTPGGSAGGSTNGEPELELDPSAAPGTAVAAVALGQGSVLKDPRASLLKPLRQRATTRNRYVVPGSRPESVVRPVSELWATVVVDQTPNLSSTPTSSTTRLGSETCHLTVAENGLASMP